MELKGHTIGFKGEYSATVLKADGTVKEFLNEEKTLRSGDVIKNLLLDNFFELLGNTGLGLSSNAYVRCGTGSTAVNVGQTSLANQMSLVSGNWPSGASSNPSGSLVGGIIKVEKPYTFTFNTGQIIGNIAELGVNFSGSGTNSNTLVQSRALVVGTQGNPTVITVTSSEQLILTYTLKAEIPAASITQTVDLILNEIPTPIEVTTAYRTTANLLGYVSLANFQFLSSVGSLIVYNGSFGAPGTAPGGASASSGFGTAIYSGAAGKSATFPFTTSQGNVSGGITAAMYENNTIFKFGFNPPIPKNADRTLSITIRQTFGRLP